MPRHQRRPAASRREARTAPIAPTPRRPRSRPARPEQTAAASNAPKVSVPSGVLSKDALLPTARKLPFLAVALVGLAILLLALGALPAGVVPNPALAEALVERRVLIAFGGLATLAAAVAAYILI